MDRLPYRIMLLCLFSSLLVPAFADRESDSLALVDLYKSTAGAAWFSPWSLDASMSTWNGVTLDAAGNVTALNLENRNLIGTLPNLNLPALLLLNLANNVLRTEIPSFTNLINLVTLDLSENRLSGPVPDFDLPALETLRLSDNLLMEAIPNFSGIPMLKTLAIDNNMLSGGLPNFDMLRSLISLRLSGNQFDGPLPDLALLPNLIILDLSDNQFFGNVPIFGAANNLFELRLSDNDLTGLIPSFSRTRFLDVLHLANNKLVGPVTTIGPLEFIRELDLSGNQLEGDIDFLADYTSLIEVDLSNNSFSGKISELPDFPELEFLNLGQNQLGDTVGNLSNLQALEFLSISSNQIGVVNTDFSNMPSLQTLQVSDNNLTFSDLLRMNAIDVPNFAYAPQKLVPLPDTIYALITEDVEIDLVVDPGTVNNTYTWVHNGEFLVATASNSLVISRVNALDEGTYSCTINNNFLPALALRSEETRLILDCPLNVSSIRDTICTGDTLVVNGVEYFETGIFRDTVVINDPGTCDSVYVIDLLVNIATDTTFADSTCSAEGYMLGDTLIRDSGTYSWTFAGSNGCDSNVTVDLTVFPSHTSVRDLDICDGDTLFVGPFTHTTTGIYFDTLQTVQGCDSVLIIDLTVIDTFLEVTTINACIGDTILYRGERYTSTTYKVEPFTSILDCDSTYILDLRIPESNEYELSREICGMDSVMIGDTFYTRTGVYRDTLTSSAGCDSIIVLDLRVVDGFDFEFDLTICRGDTVYFKGDTITEAGIFIDSLLTQGGCDSITKLRLNVVDFVPQAQEALLCPEEQLIVGNSVYTTSGVYRDTLFGEMGACDTIMVSRVSVLDSISVEDVELRLDLASDIGSIAPTIVGGSGLYEFLWSTGSTELTLSGVPAGTYTLTVIDDEGCDQSFEFLLDETTDFPLYEVSDLNLFPNPVPINEEITVSSEGLDIAEIQIFDAVGRETSLRDINLTRGNFRLTSPERPGYYSVRIWIKDSRQFIVKPLIVLD